MPATFTNTLPATKTDPHPAYDWTPTDSDTGPAAGVLVLKSKRNYCTYTVVEFPTGWQGRGFHLAKLDAGTDATEPAYDCFIARNMQDRECSCKGFAYTGSCRHLAAITDLIHNGKL